MFWSFLSMIMKKARHTNILRSVRRTPREHGGLHAALANRAVFPSHRDQTFQKIDHFGEIVMFFILKSGFSLVFSCLGSCNGLQRLFRVHFDTLWAPKCSKIVFEILKWSIFEMSDRDQVMRIFCFTDHGDSSSRIRISKLAQLNCLRFSLRRMWSIYFIVCENREFSRSDFAGFTPWNSLDLYPLSFRDLLWDTVLELRRADFDSHFWWEILLGLWFTFP